MKTVVKNEINSFLGDLRELGVDDLDQMIQTKLTETLKDMLKEDEDDYSDYPDNNDYSNVSVIRSQWHRVETEWNLDEILEELNEYFEGNYTKKDISSVWELFIDLHIKFKDGVEWEYEGDIHDDAEFGSPECQRGFDENGNLVFGKPY